MTNSIGFLLLIGTILLFVGLTIFFVIREQIHKEKLSLESEQPVREVNKTAYASLVLGTISFPPSLSFASLMIDAAVQGGGSDSPWLLSLLSMAPFGLVSVILGFRAVSVLLRNNIKERGKGYAIAGIILGLPGSILLLYFVFGPIFLG